MLFIYAMLVKIHFKIRTQKLDQDPKSYNERIRSSTLFSPQWFNHSMSPGSPVFHTEITVSIGLRVGTSIP